MNKRVKFDFEIDFTNGGGLQGQDFRLDIPGEDISEKDLADYLVDATGSDGGRFMTPSDAQLKARIDGQSQIMVRAAATL